MADYTRESIGLGHYKPVSESSPDAAFRQPLSARATPERVPNTPAPEEFEDVSQGAHNRWHFDTLGFFHWAPTPSAPLPTVPPLRANPPIQVAFIVAMPSPEDKSTPGLDYSLGLTQITCRDMTDLYGFDPDPPTERRDDAGI